MTRSGQHGIRINDQLGLQADDDLEQARKRLGKRFETEVRTHST